MIKNFLFYILFFIAISTNIMASEPLSVNFVRSYGGAYDDYVFSNASDSNGNIYTCGAFKSDIVIGDSTYINQGDRDMLLIKFDSNGNIIWSKSYASPGRDCFSSITIDNQDNIYLLGTSKGSSITIEDTTVTNPGERVSLIIKMDPNGNLIWLKTTGYKRATWVQIIRFINNKLFIVAAFSDSSFTLDNYTVNNFGDEGTTDIALIKMDTSGNVLNLEHFGGSENELGGLAILLSQNYIYLPISSFSSFTYGNDVITNRGINDAVLLKMDYNFNPIWAKSFGGTDSDNIRVGAFDSHNNIIFTIDSKSPVCEIENETFQNQGSWDAYIGKLDPNGNLLKINPLKCQDTDLIFKIKTDNNDNVYFGGFYKDYPISFGDITLPNYGDCDIFIGKMNKDFDFSWVKNYSGNEQDFLYGFDMNQSNELIINGYFVSSDFHFDNYTLSSNGERDLFIAKLSLQFKTDFTISDKTPHTSQLVQFEDLTFGNPTSWQWDFDNDGVIDSYEQNPSYRYFTNGTYSVKLITSNATKTDTLIRQNYITVTSSPNPKIYISPDTLNFSETPVGGVSELPITIKNFGSSSLEITNFTSSDSVFSSDMQSNITISQGDSVTINIKYSPSQTGNNSTELQFTSNDPEDTVYKIFANGSSQSVLPKNPQNVIITLSGNDVLLSWDAVTQNVLNQNISPSGYKIYYSNNPENGFTELYYQTSGTTYTHQNAHLNNDRLFYQIKAIINTP